jgi:hypothetical protein
MIAYLGAYAAARSAIGQMAETVIRLPASASSMP